MENLRREPGAEERRPGEPPPLPAQEFPLPLSNEQLSPVEPESNVEPESDIIEKVRQRMASTRIENPQKAVEEKSKKNEQLPPPLPGKQIEQLPPIPERSPRQNEVEGEKGIKPEQSASVEPPSLPEKKIEKNEKKIDPVAEKLATEEEAKRDKEAKEQSKERGFKILSDPKVMEMSPRRIERAFKDATGESLVKQREKIIDERMGARKLIVIRGKAAVEEYRQQLVAVEQENILEKNHVNALDTLWKRNSNVKEEDKEKYLSGMRKKLGLSGTDGNIALDKLINDGYQVEKAKTGWFSGKVKIPKPGAVLIYNSKQDLLKQTVAEAKSEVLKTADERVVSKLWEGHKMLVAERAVCAKEIIGKAVEKQEVKKKRAEYVPSSDWVAKVRSLGGDPKKIIPQEMIDFINGSQEVINDSQNGLSDYEWNRTMQAKKEANRLMEEWIDKKNKEDEEPVQKKKKIEKKKVKKEKKIVKKAAIKPKKKSKL